MNDHSTVDEEWVGADAADVDEVLESLSDVFAAKADDGSEEDSHGYVDECNVCIGFPEEAAALYGVTGIEIGIGHILKLLSESADPYDAKLFSAIGKEFYP